MIGGEGQPVPAPVVSPARRSRSRRGNSVAVLTHWNDLDKLGGREGSRALEWRIESNAGERLPGMGGSISLG